MDLTIITILFTCLGENTEKYIAFTVPIEKEVTKIDKNGEEITKNMSYILQFIDSTRFMANSLSNLVNNFSGRIYEIKCKYGLDEKKYEASGITYEVYDCFLEYTDFKDDLIEFKFLGFKKNYQKKVSRNVKGTIFLIHTVFLTMISTSLFYCCGKVFAHMNTWIIGKNSMKNHYLKKKIFTVS